MIFRISYSILQPWSVGNYDEAIRRFYRAESEPTQAMIEGTVLHQQWAAETQATKALPRLFGGTELTKPEVESKMSCLIDGWIELVGVVDLIESPERFTEYKTGSGNASKIAGTMQVPLYHYLLFQNGYTQIKEAYIRHFNQYEQKVTAGKLYLSKQTRYQAEEWVRTFASEMKSALDAS